MGRITRGLRYMTKSRFVRSVFLRVLSIVIIVSTAIVAIVFFSFASEISRNIISDRQKQLAVIEETMSKRMEEVSSIAYNMSRDSLFYTQPVEGARYSGREMSNALAKYLVGNDFIGHVAFYRLAEPERIYTSVGELSYIDFWNVYLGFDNYTQAEYLDLIKSTSGTRIIPMSEGRRQYFTYVCALPLFSNNPGAFVVILIPRSEVAPLIESQLINTAGEVAVFDTGGNEIFSVSTLEERMPLSPYSNNKSGAEEYITVEGAEYVVQRQVSLDNGWTYVSAIRLGDIIAELANKQLVFILLLMGIMLVAIFAMLVSITIQYQPISTLAGEVNENHDQEKKRKVIDESRLLSNTIATLKEDSEQKQIFQNAYYEADAASKAKSAFLSNMSHDIRTPMNAVIGMTALASKHADDPDYVRDCLKKVQVAARYLLDIINNVLDMSRIESGGFKLSMETVDLPELIQALVAMLDQSVAAKEQRLIVDVDIADKKVIADGVRLTQVFVNILSNSVKFTPSGGTIGLKARQTPSDREGDAQYIFTFTDTGVGMSSEFVKRVFDTFSRSKQADEDRVEGTGLGMAIAKNLVDMMDGEISCESELDVGTTFTVKLHFKLAPDNEDGKNAGEESANLEGLNVLTAEDNAINREIVVRMLATTKAHTVVAKNGKEALDAFADSAVGYFDAILMDLHMPVINGFEASKAIRSLERPDAATIPIFAMTASALDEEMTQIAQAGMNGHISKPCTPEALIKAIRQATRV